MKVEKFYMLLKLGIFCAIIPYTPTKKELQVCSCINKVKQKNT